MPISQEAHGWDMRTWALLAALLLGTMVLAGCSDDDDGGAEPTTSTSSTATPGPTSTSTTTTASSSTGTTTQPPVPPPGEPDNSAPAGSLAAVPAHNMTRTVNFTLDGSDPDGDNIVWDLFYGDGQSANGASFPANLTHQYPANGTYNVTFTITDGRLQTSYNVTVNATAGAPGGGGGATGAVITGSTSQTGNPVTSGGLGARGCGGFMSGQSGLDCVFGAIPVELAGHPFTFAGTGSQPDYALWSACDPALGTVVQADGGPVSGTLPAGVGCVIMWFFSTATGTLTFTVT